MSNESEETRSNRRGCILTAIPIALVLALLVAFGMGWLGAVDGKISDIPAISDGRR